jgi:Domain of unknown function (DUF4362)
MKMKPLIILGLLLTVSITGCQIREGLNTIKVENKNGHFINLEGLDKFVKEVKKNKEVSLNYISYGIEGQKSIDEISYDGKKLNVNRTVDGKNIEKYECKSIEVQENKNNKSFFLNQCSDGLNSILLAKKQK